MAETLSIEIAPTENPNSPTLEQEAAALDAVANPETRPEGLPEKFKSVDELIKSYQELERKLGAPKSEQPPTEEAPAQEEAPTEEAPQEGEKTAEEEAVEELKAQGLDVDAMSARFWETGKVADEDYTALEKAGIPRHVVDAFAEGQKALMKAAQTTVYNMVGGEQSYGELTEWAANNLPEAEINAFNEAVNSDDLNKVQLAVLGLKAKREQAVGFEPTRTVGGTAKSSNDVYESVAQLKADMADPRYARDPAFRGKVEAKLARSNIM
jgi:hypothetical protein